MLLNKIRPNWMHIHSLKDKPHAPGGYCGIPFTIGVLFHKPPIEWVFF